jgi:hypothetical protein
MLKPDPSQCRMHADQPKSARNARGNIRGNNCKSGATRQNATAKRHPKAPLLARIAVQEARWELHPTTRCRIKNPDHRHIARLSARRERPRGRRASDCFNKIAPPHRPGSSQIEGRTLPHWNAVLCITANLGPNVRIGSKREAAFFGLSQLPPAADITR